jgi:hypothetical protein
VTLATAPTCDVYATATDTTPITLSASTPAGTYVVKCTGGAVTGYVIDTYVDGVFTVGQATSTLAYTGPTLITSGTATLTASLTSPCAEGATVEFTVTPAPTPSGPYTATVSSGVASTPALTLTPGTSYSVTVSTAGDTNCTGDSTSATLGTATPGTSTTGTGTYLAGGSTVKYSHQVTSTVKTNTKAGTRTRTYRGNVTWEIPGQVRLVGTVASTLLQSLDGTLTSGSAAWVTFPCSQPTAAPASSSPHPSPKPSGPVCGSFTGIGTLQTWNPTLNKGRGGWSTTGGISVAFEVTVHDAGSTCTPTATSSSKKPKCTTTELPGDAFGISIGGTGSTDPFETTPVTISTGHIRSIA